jgi:hypothetical protein
MQDEVLINFLRGMGPDSQGRYHSDILKFSDEELESSHNYIQWLFPLREPSEAVPESPFLESVAVIEQLRRDEDVQESMVTALIRMHRFYEDNDHWLRQGDHNHLRITRILKSITLLNTRKNAQDFYDFILRRVESAQPVTAESLNYWKESLS